MHVAVTYESKTGNTEQAAHRVAAGLQKAGAAVSVFSIDNVDHGALAKADVVIVGTWCGGLFFFGQHPGGAGLGRIDRDQGGCGEGWSRRGHPDPRAAWGNGGAGNELGEDETPAAASSPTKLENGLLVGTCVTDGGCFKSLQQIGDVQQTSYR